MAQRASKLRDVLRIVKAGIQRQRNLPSFAPKDPGLSKNASPACVARYSNSPGDSSSSSLLNRAAAQVNRPGISNVAKKTPSSAPNQSFVPTEIARTIHQFRSVISYAYSHGYRSATQNSGLREFGSSTYRLWPNGSRSLPNVAFKEKKFLVSLRRGRGVGDFPAGWRAYHVDNRGVQHFKRRGPAAWTEAFVSQRSAGILVLLAGGGVVVYFTNRQTVPYTHRKHFVLISPGLERSVGDRSYEAIMQEYKNKLLPPTHPQSIRVGKIADQIIEGLMQGANASDWGKLEQGAPDVIAFSKDWDSKGSFSNGELKSDSDRSLFETDAGLLGQTHNGHTHDDAAPMDEGWVDRSRQEGLASGREGYTKHLEGMKWKVVVVDDEIVNAVCIPGGKIVVFTGLLKKFRSDAEVATVVAHEVGHAVARHSAEALTNNLFIVALQLVVLSVFYVPGLVNSVSELLLRLPFSRRMEIEADHIGLILMAAAGYDPRLAPGFYEKLGNLDKSPEYAQYMSTHPSGKKRGEMLRKTATMEEALTIYQRKMAGHGTEGFF